jgi:RNA polymerase sigma-70 factor (ECF subfamily)
MPESMEAAGPGASGTDAAGARFLTTRWTLVRSATAADAERSQAALADLCRDYWLPLYAFLRRRGLTADGAADTVQGFFARLLEKRDFGALSPDRGRFRGFLLAALQHHLSHERERERAEKRGGGRPVVPIDPLDADTRLGLSAGDAESPERAYQRAWALALLARVLEGLRAEYDADGKGELFERLKPVLEGRELEDVAALAEALGTTPGAVKVAGTRLRRRYGERLRSAILDTVGSEAEVEDEIHALFAALGR